MTLFMKSMLIIHESVFGVRERNTIRESGNREENKTRQNALKEEVKK